MTITTRDADIKERLSIAYVTAVAARAGCEINEVHVDRNGIDATIRAIRGTPAKIDIQLKATSVASAQDGDDLALDLDVNTYNKLRSTVIQAPQILVALALPQDGAHWLVGDAETLVFKRCAYWKNLYGEPEMPNEATVRVHLSRSQMFHPDTLRDLMARAHARAVAGQTGI